MSLRIARHKTKVIPYGTCKDRYIIVGRVRLIADSSLHVRERFIIRFIPFILHPLPLFLFRVIGR